MPFYIQDPEDPETIFLLEALAAEATDSSGGGGAFAWATAKGADILFQEESFRRLLSNHKFDLIVGLDAVTNEIALNTLQMHAEALDGLSVEIFIHDYSGCFFHPKFSWFRQGEYGKLIAGSGNLTEAGLRGNWEAFSISTLSPPELEEIEKYWTNWKTKHAAQLVKPNDETAIERAKRNVGWSGGQGGGKKTSPVKKLPPSKQATKKVAAGAPAAESVEDVLVAEIPKGSIRWNQANFDLNNYEGFFGAKVGTQRRMFFRHIAGDGSVGETEVRPSVAVKSSNWRFELAAGAGVDYPDSGRPIGIFVKEAARSFRYQLLMPSDEGHDVLAKFLEDNWSGPASRIKRVRTSASKLQMLWPESALWKVEYLVAE